MYLMELKSKKFSKISQKKILINNEKKKRTEQERLQEFVKQKGISIAKSEKGFV